MVGEGVLLECLKHPDVEQVLVIGRKPCGVAHPKLKEIVHSDLYDWTPIESQLRDTMPATSVWESRPSGRPRKCTEG